MTALTTLTALCPPPASPPQGSDWSDVENTLGVALPQDYKQLVDTYGPGQFCDFITLYHPGAPSEWADLTGPMPTRLREQIEEVRQVAERPWPLPHPVEELQAMGVTENGDYLFWATRPTDAPGRWPVAVNEALGAPWFTYDGTVSEFLVSVLRNDVQVPMFPGGLLDRGVFFTPSSLHSPVTATASEVPIDTHRVRKWAQGRGYDLPDRGRIPLEIVRAWERANRR
ncbi:hypothetical protein C6N75_13475 [Streptomyces solincola]|uniref:Knr4/Smi1-like domain-containing protein n=1 Tax=Streptomyces solincola TaxID=2100817 RepID=A0A2S9PWC4_9ACTN|nr:SMI1/KNR4 family protein [Streptomyces solincola]PRH78708.1 hypothetical protein C6N75_13475 [Streptomyces solincola]